MQCRDIKFVFLDDKYSNDTFFCGLVSFCFTGGMFYFIYAPTISAVTVRSLEMQNIVRREAGMYKESWLGFWSEHDMFTRVASIHCIMVISWQ
jgi:hypothetical protein